jgi:hypothetical protein
MAGSFSDYMEKYVLDNCFGQNTTAISTGGLANLYIALLESTADNLGDAWTNTATGECPGSTYARKSFTNSTANWCNTTAGSGIKKLKTAITFTTAAGNDWGTIGGFAICNSNSTASGWALCWTTLTGGAKVVNSGDSLVVTTDLTITLG